MTPCKFFGRGYCARGGTCMFSHEEAHATTSNTQINASVTPVDDSSHHPSTTAQACRFFVQGHCVRGAACLYKHVAAQTTPMEATVSEDGIVKDENVDKLATTFARLDTASSSCALDLLGATVCFDSGAVVSSLKLASDYSKVQITNLPSSATPKRLSEYLLRSGLEVSPERILVKALDKSSAVAELIVDDPRFANKAALLLDEIVFEECKIRVRPAQVVNKVDASSNHLQVSSVVCSWYKPSRVAWAHYRHSREARKSADIVNGKMFHGCKLACTFQEPSGRIGRNPIFSVQIGNLAATVTTEQLSRRFPSAFEVKLGPLSYSTSTGEASELVRKHISGAGNITFFDVSTTSSARYVKALARFATPQEARIAVQKFNGQSVSRLGNSKIFLSLQVSVKFRVLFDMYSAIREELNDLKVQALADNHVTLKIYAAGQPGQLLTLRIYGEDVKSVARVKSSVEKLLHGTVAIIEGHVLWDDFFLPPTGLHYLKEVQKAHGAFVYADARKRQLTLYGPETAQHEVLKTLSKKIENLSSRNQDINLDKESHRLALRGGFVRILEEFGKDRARLNVTQKKITIRGTEADRSKAVTILHDTHSENNGRDTATTTGCNDCPICWTEPTDAIKLACNHEYCAECFAGQCAPSAIDPHFLPLTCQGEESRCTHIISIDELQSNLTPDGFTALLEASLKNAYISTRPTELQYCLTPDCPSIYRVSSDGLVFTCPTCLADICTTCAVTAHDGSTCAEYKELSSEGAVEFRKWMQENKVKPCPKCNTPIQKSYGCNHMECSACKAHFCWFCLEVFGGPGGGRIYAHMIEKHENIGTEEPVEVEDERAEMGRLMDLAG